MTSAKARLQMEAQESAKKLNEMKLSLEHAGLDKNKFATQLDELRRAADNEARKWVDSSLSVATFGLILDYSKSHPKTRPKKLGALIVSQRSVTKSNAPNCAFLGCEGQ